MVVLGRGSALGRLRTTAIRVEWVELSKPREPSSLVASWLTQQPGRSPHFPFHNPQAPRCGEAHPCALEQGQPCYQSLAWAPKSP